MKTQFWSKNSNKIAKGAKAAAMTTIIVPVMINSISPRHNSGDRSQARGDTTS